MFSRIVTSIGFGLLIVASPTRAQVSLPASFVDEPMLTGLDQPNSFAFLPDGRVLFTELTSGKIRMMVNGQLALSDPCAVVDSLTIDAANERGLQGIAVDPRWPTFPYVYVVYTHIGSRIVLARYTASGDLGDPLGTHLWLGSKRTLIHDIVDTQAHNGLGVRFALDGTLLLSTGDDGSRCDAQVPGSLRGALLRMDVTRVPPAPGGPPPRALLIPSGNPSVGPDSNACLEYA